MRFKFISTLCFLILIITKSFGVTHVTTHVASTVGGNVGIGIRITLPDTMRYSCGAPVVLFIRGGRKAGTMAVTDYKASDYGVIIVEFNFPSGGTGAEASGGTFDLRGYNSVVAARDVAKFAQGLIPDKTGHYFASLCGSTIPLYSSFGIMGSSEGGNTAVVLAGLFPSSLPYLKWIGFWESPIGLGTMVYDPGYYDFGPGYNYSYDPNTGQFNWNDLKYDPNIIVDSTSSGFIVGGCYFDSNHNSQYDATTDWLCMGIFYQQKYYLSQQVIDHAYANNIVPLNPPSHFPTSAGAQNFWLYREGENWVDSTIKYFPNLITVLASTDSDHVCSAPDHPHSLLLNNKLLTGGLPLVHFNSDRVYPQMILRNLTTVPIDNDANQFYDHLSIRSHIQDEHVLSDINFKVAIILECCDRSQMGEVSVNLNAVPNKNCITSTSLSITQTGTCFNNKQLNASPSVPSFYNYNWTPAVGLSDSHISNPVFSDTTSRTYTCSIINPITGWTASSNIFVEGIHTIHYSKAVTPVTCGIPNGTSTVMATGNFPSLQILWSDNNQQFSRTGLAAGVLYFTISDLSSCSVNDSVSIIANSICNQPSITTVSNFIDSSLVINWNSNSCYTGMNIQFRQSGLLNWSNVFSQNSLADTIQYLLPNTNYEIQLEAVCSLSPSVLSQNSNLIIQRTRPHACFETPVTYADSVTSSTATIHWQTDPSILDWQIAYRKTSVTTWSFISVSGSATSYVLTGLLANENYTVRLKNHCFQNPLMFSPSTSPFSFQTVFPNCPFTNALSATLITPDSAQIIWNSSAGAGNYQIDFKKSSESVWQSLNSIFNQVVIHNLIPNTAYDVRIKSFCTNYSNWSNYSDTISFTTPVPPCLPPTVIQAIHLASDSVTIQWNIAYGSGKTIVYYKPIAATNWIADSVGTGVNHFTANSLTPVTSYLFYLKSYCGINNNYSENSDTIAITTLLNLCASPVNINPVVIGRDSIKISWTNSSNSNGTIVYYKLSGASTWNSSLPLSTITNTYTLHGLAYGTSYQICLASVCSQVNANSNNSDTILVTTLTPCLPPTNIWIGNITSTTAVVHFTGYPSVSYKLKYTNMSNGMVKSTNANPGVISKKLKSLSSSTSYQVSIRSVCGSAFSPYSAAINFTTASLKLENGFVQTENELLPAFSVSPNPFADEINLKWVDLPFGKVQISLVNLLGQKLLSLTYLNESYDGEIQLLTGNLVPGLYYIKIIYEGGVQCMPVIH